jgi:hypothetical protein
MFFLCIFVSMCVCLSVCERSRACVFCIFFWCGCMSVFLGAVSLTAAGVCGFFLFSFEGPKLFFILGSVLVF